MPKTDLTPKQRELVEKYTARARKLGRHLTRADLRDLGFSRDSLRALFTNLNGLKKAAVSADPKAFDGVFDSEILKSNSHKRLQQDLRKFKRLIITTYVDGQPIHKGFVQNLKLYAKDQDALLLVIPAGKELKSIDPLLSSDVFIFDDVGLNDNLVVRGRFRVPPKNSNPLTSLARIGQRDRSTIVASPKQFLQMVGTGNVKLPHAIMSTGACTRPDYGRADGSNRIDYFAEHDHTVGALVVELEPNDRYHFRQIQSEKDGSFADLGRYYSKGRVSKLAPEAMVVGDLHVLETDPLARKAWFEIMDHTGCSTAIWHDAFSGVSINHHEEDDEIRRAQLMSLGLLSLEHECREFAKEVDNWTSRGIKLIIVDSNHHDFLVTYIKKGMYHRDPQNLDFASKLVSPMVAGQNPLRYAVEKLIGIKHPSMVTWLGPDDDKKIAGVQVAAHGHRGSNGKKNPGAAGMEAAYGSVMYGHTHTPHILRAAWCVGTSSHLKLAYNPGASSWLHCSGLIYPSGERQLIMVFDGKWRRT